MITVATEAQPVRTVAIVGYQNSGKSALRAALGGTAVVSQINHHGHKINLLDAPGPWALSVADAAIFVVSAVQGIDPGSAQQWQDCADRGLPRLVAITHVDDPSADFEESVSLAQRVFGEGVYAAGLPVFDQPAATLISVGPPMEPIIGVLEFLSYQLRDDRTGELSLATSDHQQAVQPFRAELIEFLLTNSPHEELFAQYLAGEEPSPEVLTTEYLAGVRAGFNHPAVPTVGPTNVGVTLLLDLLTHLPPISVLPRVHTSCGEPTEPLTGDPQGPLVGLILAVTDAGAWVRVLNGTLRPGPISVAAVTASLDHIQDPTGSPTLAVAAGDVGFALGLAHAHPGQTLAEAGADIRIAPWQHG